MKKTVLKFVVLSLLFGVSPYVTIHAQEHNHESMNMSTKAKQSDVYVCPMHPHIHGKEGDNCPICGMSLVPAQADPMMDDMDMGEADDSPSYRISKAMVQNIGVQTSTVELKNFGGDVRAYGRVVPSSRVESKISLRVEGWVEDLATSAIGDVVKKGDRLFNLNSPQLISAQTDYLTARSLGNKDIAKAALQRLKQLGVGLKALKLIKKQKSALLAVPFYAPTSGVISDLNVRNGDYIKVAAPLLSIQDLSTVWVEANVPERDLITLKQGDPVNISLPDVGEKRVGQVAYIQPTVDPETRTGEVRIELENKDGTLKPDSFVDVTFSAQHQKRLAIPQEAILRGSMGAYVLHYLGDGRFKPVMVKTGVKSKDFVEVKDGLERGQEIVTSGQFLLDAEANLKSGMGSMAGHDHEDMQPAKKQDDMGGMNHAGY
jgi:Cu(I)/Ag(I) efflux system membrane fusion protein